MKFDLLIVGARIYSSTENSVGDIGIVEGKIVAVGDLAGVPAIEVLNARGLAAFPGLIDTQVHFREPGLEHKEDIHTGSRAAVLGGVTTYFEMPNTTPLTVDETTLADKLSRAQGRSFANYAFFVGGTAENAERVHELETLPGTPGIKIFMGSSTGSLLVPDDETLTDILSRVRRRVAIHAEDHLRLESRKALISANPTVHEHPVLRDAECARLATERILSIAEKTGGRVHILHISTAEELPLLTKAKAAGIATCEITPQHLWFSAPECYERLGTRAQMNPPLRSTAHRQALRAALAEGLFEVMGSDHAPHTLAEKALPYPKSPSGMPGVQTMLPAFLTMSQRDGLLSIEDVIRLGCEAPANLYGIADKGKIAEGYDADLVLVDLDRRWTFGRDEVGSKCGWSPFEGEEFWGKPIHTVVQGQICVRDCAIDGKPSGRVAVFK